jgi:hypothetical protein
LHKIPFIFECLTKKGFIMYEHKKKPLLSKSKFYLRIFKHFLGALTVVLVSLLIGIAGYHYTENLSLLDSLLNASMILGGMGPIAELHTAAGKLFASVYALFSGIVFLVVVGVLFVPFFHRFLHKFHIGTD